MPSRPPERHRATSRRLVVLAVSVVFRRVREASNPTAGGRQLVACPLAKGTLATQSLDSIFGDFLVQFLCSRSLRRLFWVISRVSRVRDLVRESSRNLLEEFEDPSDLLE